MADTFMGANTSPDRLRAAFADVYGVPVIQVAIRSCLSPWPRAEVILEYVNEDAPVPGDYPVQVLP